MVKRPSLFALLFPLFLLCTSLAYTADFRWTKKASMSVTRSDFAAATVSGKIYVFGGKESAGANDTTAGILASIEMYDPATDQWTVVGQMSTQRRNMGVAVVNQKIYVIGGGMKDGTQIALVEEFDPVTSSCVVKSSMTVARFSMGVAAVNNKIYAVGGYNHTIGSGPLNVVEEYDPVADTWTTKGSIAVKRYGICTAVVNNQLYIIGGYKAPIGTPSPIDIVSLVEVYDQPSDSWTTKTPIPTLRVNPSVVALDNMMYVLGGYGLGGDSKIIEVYDPLHDSWTRKRDMITARQLAAAVVVNGNMYLIGGNQSYSSYLSLVEEGELNTLDTTVNNMYAYPCPACLSKGDVIKFANVAPNTTFTIVSPAGYIVRTLSADAYGYIAPWDGTADDGGKLGSGTYIVRATDDKSNVKIFSILIVR